jgi:hypothetical protein
MHKSAILNRGIDPPPVVTGRPNLSPRESCPARESNLKAVGLLSESQGCTVTMTLPSANLPSYPAPPYTHAPLCGGSISRLARRKSRKLKSKFGPVRRASGGYLAFLGLGLAAELDLSTLSLLFLLLLIV